MTRTDGNRRVSENVPSEGHSANEVHLAREVRPSTITIIAEWPDAYTFQTALTFLETFLPYMADNVVVTSLGREAD